MSYRLDKYNKDQQFKCKMEDNILNFNQSRI
jgi:hypothetical protein